MDRCVKVCRIKMKSTQLECYRPPLSFRKNGLFALPRRHHQRRPSQDVPVDADGDGEGGRPLYSLDPEAETSWQPALRSAPESQPSVLSAGSSGNERESRFAHHAWTAPLRDRVRRPAEPTAPIDRMMNPVVTTLEAMQIQITAHRLFARPVRSRTRAETRGTLRSLGFAA